jgi:hypothetical protein
MVKKSTDSIDEPSFKKSSGAARMKKTVLLFLCFW